MHSIFSKLGFVALFFTPIACWASSPYQLTKQQLDGTTYELSIDASIPKGDALYADYLSFSIDHPNIILSEWKASQEPISKYDTHFKQTKKIFTEPVRLTLQASLSDPSIDTATLHMTTLSRAGQKQQQQQFELSFASAEIPENAHAEMRSTEKIATIDASQDSEESETCSLQNRLVALFTKTQSWPIRLLLALLLGLLLSLTPCIYPMIPITIGVLQAQGSASVGRNFLSALAYVTGIATMFSTLGTIAAFSGKMFGSIMCNPFVILGIVLLLIYLAGSMIGLYDMYVPRFLQGNQKEIKSRSLFSIFLFGAASGTAASPCLSPGLVLLLSMVTALGNMWLGFLLLFFFGLGLGIPLLIIGTFSSSLSVLPRAGMWMIDVKQFFGFIMLATSLYFLGTIVPEYIIAWMSALFSVSVGIFYFVAANKAPSLTTRIIKNIVGISLIAFSVYLSYEAYKQTDIHLYGTQSGSIWMHDYTQALALANTENKQMFIDISAPYCSICRAINKKIFSDTNVQKKLSQFIAVKIDDVEKNKVTLALAKKFAIIGAPTILIYDPKADKEIKRWGGELYELTPEEFMELI